MGTRADELKSDLDRQREALGHDLEAVGDRVSPARMAERRRAAVRQRLTGARTRMSQVRHRVMGLPDTARSRASDTTGTARDRAAEVAGNAEDRLASAAGTARERVAEAPQAIQQATEGNPLAAGMIAFGAGLLAAGLVPPTKRERRAAERIEPALSDVKDEATSVAKEAAEHLRPKAEDAATQLRDRASTAADRVSTEASQAADEVRSQASRAAEDVKSEAKDAAQRTPGSGSDLGR